MSDELTCLDL